VHNVVRMRGDGIDVWRRVPLSRFRAGWHRPE
jgi:hypothetical protein